MEFIFVLTVLGFVSLAILLVLLVTAGIAALCGASFGTVFLNGLWVLVIPPAVILYGWLIGRNQVTVNHIEIASEHLPASFDGYRIVHISDMHLRSFKSRDRALERIIDRINAEDPDLIAFTGDLVTTHPLEILPHMDVLGRLQAEDGVVSVMGNHDYCPYNDWSSEQEMLDAVDTVRARERRLGWKLLDDAHIDIARQGTGKTDTISVIGVENISAMRQFATHGDLQKAMAGADGDFRILLSHDPTHWKAGVLGQKDIDLMLSGHTHNAQCRIFGFEPSHLVFRENSGLYSEETAYGRQYLYVNDGLGETMFPARIGVPPEITVITLSTADGNIVR